MQTVRRAKLMIYFNASSGGSSSITVYDGLIKDAGAYVAPIHPNSLYPLGVFGLFNSTKLYPSTMSTVIVDDSVIIISFKLLFSYSLDTINHSFRFNLQTF